MDFVPFCKLTIIFVVFTILKGGKFSPFEAIFHIKNFLKTGADEIDFAVAGLVGDGWHHLAYSVDDANNTHAI